MLHYEGIDLLLLTGATALLILAVKKVAGRRLSPGAHVAIWAVLLLQLALFPVRELAPRSSLSLENYLPTAAVAGTAAQLPGGAGAGAAFAAVFPAALWGAGAALLLGAFLFSHWRHMRRLRSLPVCRDEAALALLLEYRQKLRVRRTIRLRSGVDSPQLAGLLRPAVYLSGFETREELRCIMVHELCHYKHRDLWLNLLAVFILCLFWFNPIIWVCFRVFKRDLEMYCDAAAVAALGDKKRYSLALLKAAAGKDRFILAASSFLNGEKEVSRRIKRLAGYKKPRFWASAAAAALIVLLGAVCLTGGISGGDGSAAGTGERNPALDGPAAGGIRSSRDAAEVLTSDAGQGAGTVAAVSSGAAQAPKEEREPKRPQSESGVLEAETGGRGESGGADPAETGGGVSADGEVVVLDLAELERLAELAGQAD